MEYSSITSMLIKKRDESQEYNSVTGTWDTPPDDKDGSVEKGTKWPSLCPRDTDDDDDELLFLSKLEEGSERHFEKCIQRTIPIFIDKSKADERIVCGVVYEPDTVDAQGDSASAEEIRKAAYYFMEKTRQFKVMHKGKSVKIEILENYIAPQNIEISGREIKKGSWILVTRINDDKIWKAIKAGKLTGYSMAGYAKVA